MKRMVVCAAMSLMLITPAGFSDTDSVVKALEQGNHARAFELVMPLANQGDAHAQYLLGTMYMGGLGVPRDWQQAADWFRRATSQEHEYARLMLAVTLDGLGETQEALLHYRWAAEKGDEMAQTRLGQMYESGVLDVRKCGKD